MKRLAALCLLAGCTERALEVPQHADLAVPDLAMPDLRVVDLAGEDLTRPVFCDGIFTVDTGRTLRFFDPKALTFSTIGFLDCPAASGTTPFSMAVARDGTAYVEFTDGTLFRADTTTSECVATSFVPGQAGFQTFGMGFATDQAGGTTETLYIDDGVNRLARIDLTDLTVHPIATIPGDSRAELTGTGNAELWGFFADAVSHVGRIDRQTGALSPDVPLPTLGDTSQDGFAFGFYGGLFYAFLDAGLGAEVVRIDTSTGKAVPVVPNSGFDIVGAGVSTCAPTE